MSLFGMFTENVHSSGLPDHFSFGMRTLGLNVKSKGQRVFMTAISPLDSPRFFPNFPDNLIAAVIGCFMRKMSVGLTVGMEFLPLGRSLGLDSTLW